jgi:uncharacterized membrane-anchored protein
MQVMLITTYRKTAVLKVETNIINSIAANLKVETDIITSITASMKVETLVSSGDILSISLTDASTEQISANEIPLKKITSVLNVST